MKPIRIWLIIWTVLAISCGWIAWSMMGEIAQVLIAVYPMMLPPRVATLVGLTQPLALVAVAYVAGISTVLAFKAARKEEKNNDEPSY